MHGFAPTSTDPGQTGLVFNIQYHSTEDGPGIRTSLFLKGCLMHCPWCHNPEGRRPFVELAWHEQRCIGAKRCVPICPHQALELTSGGVVIDRQRCNGCSECVDACPTDALEMTARHYTVEEVLPRLLADRVFYEKSGGGVTLSGGEVSLQGRFAGKLMERLRSEGIHIALDTCGGTRWKTLGPLIELADLVLYDLKIMDEADHKEHTGVPLRLVLENARRIAAMGKPIWVRTPIIPGYTDSEENIRQVARFIATELPTVERYDLLAFNNTCALKYGRLRMPWTLGDDTPLVAQPTMERLVALAEAEGLGLVRWSGLTDRDGTAANRERPPAAGHTSP